jgi:hypothetical protein
MGTWTDTRAAYRLLKNPKVTPEKILEPHQNSVRCRITEHRVILAVQDTTELNFTAHPATQGLGTIGSSPTLKGMHVHTTMAFTVERVPLGLIQQHTWIRPEKDFGKKTERKKKASSMKTRLLVRASGDRRVECEEDYLWAHVEAAPAANVFDMLVPVKKSKKVRTATLELRFAPVAICAPRERRATEEPIPLYAVYVNEPNPPEGVTALSWAHGVVAGASGTRNDLFRVVRVWPGTISSLGSHAIPLLVSSGSESPP